MKQDYKNHIRYYPPHHFIFLPLMLILIILGIVKAVNDIEHQLEWGLFSLLAFCIFYLAVMLRQHYALGNQNRIVRLEFRLRYFELYGASSREIESQLNFGQIAALRFADDTAFKDLLERTLAEQLTGREIKKSIVDWQGDYMRV